MKIKESFWAAVGKIGAVAGLVATLVGLWTLYSAPRGNLVADLRFGPIFWPPAAQIEREKTLELLEPESLVKILSEEEAKEGPVLNDARRIANEIGYHLRQDIRERENYTRLGGYWIADVRNQGNLSTENAAINLPGAVLAVTITGGATAQTGEAKPASVDSGVVPLGTIRPNGKVRVIAWTISEPSDYSLREVVLSHQGGVGALIVYRVRPPLAVSVKNNWPLMLLPAWLLLSGGVLFWHWFRQQRRNTRKVKHRAAITSGSKPQNDKKGTETSAANQAPAADGKAAEGQ